jgi:hypothetical protein
MTEQHPFVNFSHSVAAARALMARAQESGSWIEGIVLYASVIDALLRILVAHATADRDGSVTHLDSTWFVHDDRVWRNERAVYKAALDAGVLIEQQFEELEELYKFRNVVIHRFVISGITYDVIPSALDEYELIYRRLMAQLEAIEQPAPPVSDEQVKAIRGRIARKLGEAASGDF